MFGIGGMELLVILLVGVVVLGPERLPVVMRKVTKLMSEFRRVSTDLQRTINAELNLEELNRQQLESSKTIARPPKKKKKPAPEAAEPADKAPAEAPAETPAEAPQKAPEKIITEEAPQAEAPVENTPAPEVPNSAVESEDKA